jgi:hypothetical protein
MQRYIRHARFRNAAAPSQHCIGQKIGTMLHRAKKAPKTSLFWGL